MRDVCHLEAAGTCDVAVCGILLDGNTRHTHLKHLVSCQNCIDIANAVSGRDAILANSSSQKCVTIPPMTDTEAKQLVKAAASVVIDAVVDAIGHDGHQWSTRPCGTCKTVSGLIGRPFGCYKYQEDLKAKGIKI